MCLITFPQSKGEEVGAVPSTPTSHAEMSYCKENKMEKVTKSLYKDIFLYYMGTLPACQQ